MDIIPYEISEKILYNYISLYMKPMKDVHNEIINSVPILHLSEDYFDFELDFVYALRLPKLFKI